MNYSPDTNFNGYWDRNNSKIKNFKYFEVWDKDYVKEDKKEKKYS